VKNNELIPLIPAKAGIQGLVQGVWVPAFAGTSVFSLICAGRGWSLKLGRSGEIRPLSFFVYVLASRRNGTLYIGMPDDLVRRVWQHRTGLIAGFTKEYSVKTLVWYELHETRESAFQRERQLKKWNRTWKLQLIEKFNPQWRDLFDEVSS
jgi:putative endonuclease